MHRLLATVFTILALPLGANAQWQFNGVPVSTALHYQAAPVIVTDGAGGAIIAWIDYRNGNYDIYAQRLNAAGVPQWAADGVPLCTQPGNQITLSMVSDDAGGAVLVWYDARNSIQTGLDIYAQRVNGSGTPLWTADGVAVCQAANDQSEPYVVKSVNNYVIAWFDYRNGSASDVYVQALNGNGSWQWIDPDGVAVCTAAGNQFRVHLSQDGLGGAVVTWDDTRSGSSDIYARRVNQLGAVQWSANGVVVCNAADEQYDPQPVSDAAAGAIIAWYDWRNGAPDIYMQRIDSSGASLWTANGNAICTAPFTQDSPSMVSDVSGGATVVWADHRNGANADIYAQHVTPAGAIMYPADGIAICTAAGEQFTPRITKDPASAGIVTWFDRRSGNSDVYAQRLDYGTGVSLWTSNGVVLCTETHAQEGACVVADGSGGAIVAWADLREGNYYDIYAEHVNEGGPTAVGNTPAATSLRASNYPNPFTGETTLQLTLPSASDVSVDVYDVAGRRVREYSFSHQAKGWRSLQLDDRDARGVLLPSGVYFYRVRAGNETVTKKMVIAR